MWLCVCILATLMWKEIRYNTSNLFKKAPYKTLFFSLSLSLFNYLSLSCSLLISISVSISISLFCLQAKCKGCCNYKIEGISWVLELPCGKSLSVKIHRTVKWAQNKPHLSWITSMRLESCFSLIYSWRITFAYGI